MLTTCAPPRDIHEVVDLRAVTTVYQPLVEIATGRVIGYEALARGPVNTPWHSPVALFTAARHAGRHLELDWVCRAEAYRGAAAAGLDPAATLFVNCEPAAWRYPCPGDLASVVAADGLRVVVEMTERAIAADPSALLAATAASRARGHGVALDDVGADPMSLALMPFVHPDVVKLDMGLLRQPHDRHTAQVVTAVAAYAESSGATVLAEGIEDERHLALARTMGATIGQGWHFGRPGPLPAASAVPHAPLPLLDVGPVPAASVRHRAPTPFSVVAERRPVVTTTKAALMPVSRYLEALAGEGTQPPVLLACFQDRRHFTPATARRFADLAGRSPLVAALAVGLGDVPAAGVRGARLASDDPLRGEWNVIVVGPHHAAALVARDLGDDGADADRRFDFAVTYDRPLVVEAARSLLRWLSPVASVDHRHSVTRSVRVENCGPSGPDRDPCAPGW